MGSRLRVVAAGLAITGLLAACGSSTPARTRSSNPSGLSTKIQARPAQADGPIGPGILTSQPSEVCAPSDAGTHLVSHRRGSRHHLVPPGATTLTLCSYNGMNATRKLPQWGLKAIGVSSNAKTITALVRKLDALKPQSGVFSCPMDDGTEIIAGFGYNSAPGNPVTVNVSGCESADNGHISRMILASNLVTLMRRLTKPVTRPYATIRGSIVGCTPRHYRPVNCSHPGAVIAFQHNRLIGSAEPYHGYFRLKLAIAGGVTIALQGEGQQVNTRVTVLRSRVTLGRTTSVRLRQPPFGELIAQITQCGGVCPTLPYSKAFEVRVQTPTQIRGQNLDTSPLSSPRFRDDLPPGRYKLSLLTDNEHRVRAVRMITVRAHKVTSVKL